MAFAPIIKPVLVCAAIGMDNNYKTQSILQPFIKFIFHFQQSSCLGEGGSIKIEYNTNIITIEKVELIGRRPARTFPSGKGWE